MLNSAVLMVAKETAKEFVLKDETGVIKCIFYQIVSNSVVSTTLLILYSCWEAFSASAVNTHRLLVPIYQPLSSLVLIHADE